MQKAVWTIAVLAIGLVMTSPAEAKARLVKAKCPYQADAAFRIVGARGEQDGVASEYAWLAENRPGWKRNQQALVNAGPKLYDLLFISKGRKKQVICFDITAFFGKNANR